SCHRCPRIRADDAFREIERAFARPLLRVESLGQKTPDSTRSMGQPSPVGSIPTRGYIHASAPRNSGSRYGRTHSRTEITKGSDIRMIGACSALHRASFLQPLSPG